MPKSRPRRERTAVPAGPIYQLKVTLNDAPVPIWRTVQVPAL